MCLSIVGSMGIWAVVAIIPAVESELEVGRAEATLPFTAAMIGFALGNLTLGRAVDRFGISMVLVVAGCALAFGYVSASFASSIYTLTVLTFFQGFGSSACFGPLIADVSQWFMKRRGIAVAVTASGNYLSGALWSPTIIWFSDDFGWRGAYVALGIICFLVLLPGALFLRRQIDQSSTDIATADAARHAATTGLSHQTLTVLLAAAGIGCCVAMSMPQVHIIALCVDRGFGAAAGAEMLSLMLMGGVVSRLVSGALADRLGGLPTLLIGSVLQTAGLCLYLIEGGLTSLYLISLAFGLSQGGIVPSYAIIVREYMPPREAGRRVGLVISATILGMALGGWLTGWLYDIYGSYTVALWNGIGFNLFNAAIVLTILYRIGRHQNAAA